MNMIKSFDVYIIVLHNQTTFSFVCGQDYTKEEKNVWLCEARESRGKELERNKTKTT